MMIKEGDLFIDERCGLFGTVIVCTHISKSWLRRRKPFAFIQTFYEGRVSRNRRTFWLSEKEVTEIKNWTETVRGISYIPKEKNETQS
jgi:hypothetical protein